MTNNDDLARKLKQRAMCPDDAGGVMVGAMSLLAILAERDADKKRIAELEALTVSVKPDPWRSFVTNDDITALNRFAECCDDPGSGGHDLDKDQVSRLEKIGVLQRSGRISYITDFGDFIISVYAGIKLEPGE